MPHTRLLGWLKLDRAIVFSVANQAQNAIFLLVTLAVVATRLSAEEQGYYYTFASIVGLQVLIELGLLQCIVQFASHESAHLSVTDSGVSGPSGPAQRLGSLLRFSVRWYAVAAAVILVVLLVSGWLVFAKPQYAHIHWQGPWIWLAVVTAGMVLVDPFWAILEGCNQVGKVAQIRFGLTLAKNITLAVVLLAGGGLHAVSLSAAVYWLAGCAWLWSCRRNFFRALWREGGIAGGAAISWRSEIWPYQWRIGLSWLSGYFIFTALNPIIFLLLGAVAAGQFGMTWTVLAGAAAFGRVWMRTKSPRLGQLIATGQRAELDRVWFGACLRAMVLAGFVSLVLVAGLGLAPWLLPQYDGRVLGPGLAAGIALANVLNEAVICMAFYLRAHKEEPYLWLSVGGAVGSCLVVPASTALWGIQGTVMGFALVSLAGLLIAWKIFSDFRIRKGMSLPTV